LRYNGLMSEDPIRATGRDSETGDRMQRVRVGLTGLAVVLLIIAFAAAVFRRVDDQAGTSTANNSAKVLPPSINEPLAELGVAPGAAEEEVPNATAKQ
jgi:hypothetical protein